MSVRDEFDYAKVPKWAGDTTTTWSHANVDQRIVDHEDLAWVTALVSR